MFLLLVIVFVLVQNFVSVIILFLFLISTAINIIYSKIINRGGIHLFISLDSLMGPEVGWGLHPHNFQSVLPASSGMSTSDNFRFNIRFPGFWKLNIRSLPPLPPYAPAFRSSEKRNPTLDHLYIIYI